MFTKIKSVGLLGLESYMIDVELNITNGKFQRPEELLNVDGIGPGKLEAILDYVITGG